MRLLVECLQRLYAENRITKEYVEGKLSSGAITQDEYSYILGIEG